MASQASISLAPKIAFSMEGEGKEHKFWDLKAQTAQIKHNILTMWLIPISTDPHFHFGWPVEMDL